MFKRKNIFFLSFVLNMLAYQLVQDKLRMEWRGVNILLDYFLGVAPNFFAAIALPSFFFYITRYVSTISKHPLALSISTALIGLVGWEFVQILSTKGHFDWHDILWTFAGCTAFYGFAKMIDK